MRGRYVAGVARFSVVALVAIACANSQTVSAETLLSGVVAQGGPVAAARITVVDSAGTRLQASTDANGRYAMDIGGLVAPLLVSSIPAGGNTNCRYNDRPRAACMAAYVAALKPGGNVANVNPLTDRIASDIAVALKYIGPQQMVGSGKARIVDAAVLQVALGHQRAGFSSALAAAGVSDVVAFDPVSTPMNADGKGVDAVLGLIHHTRNYDNNTGESAHTVLTDISFRPIVGLSGSGAYEPLDFVRAQRELEQIRTASVRVLVVGDSTAATYELGRSPRMGWGQVFERRFKPGSRVKVLNGARAGRASRDFFNGGWYGQMARFMKAGDYVIINHGHNDQNCDGRRAVRGAADVANLCTYPNDAAGKRQFPASQPGMSFQTSLENYVSLARAAGATPLLMTPTTRYWNVDRITAYTSGDMRPVVPNHFTEQNEANGFAFVGDYSQTIRDTANANGVALIDLEAKSIAFANAHASDWKAYWLAVDAADPRYPYYRTQTTGTLASPDTTHFQQAGAEAVADMVAQGIRELPSLTGLAALLQ